MSVIESKKNFLSDFTKSQLDKSRFEVKVKDSNLLIIDKMFNKKYLYEGFSIVLLVDEENKIYYLLNKDGQDTLEENKIITGSTNKSGFLFSEDMLENGIKMRILISKNCFMNKNFEIIQDILKNLNIFLEKRCPDLKLVFNAYNNLQIFEDNIYDTSILCLYHYESCISNILIKVKHDILEINSYTESNYSKNKYNELLICVVILICYKLICNDIQVNKLLLNPINVIDSQFLISNFSTIVYKKNILEESENIYKIIVHLNEENYNKAYQLFLRLVALVDEQTIICPKQPVVINQGESGNGCYINPPLNCKNPQLNIKYKNVLPNGKYKYGIKIIDPLISDQIKNELKIARILYTIDPTQEYFIYLIPEDECHIIENQYVKNAEACNEIKSKTIGYFVRDTGIIFKSFLDDPKNYGVDKTINSISYFIGLIIHLLTALKILFENDLLYNDWHHYDNIMFDESEGKPKFIDFGLTCSITGAYKHELALKEYKKMPIDKIDEEKIKQIVDAEFLKNPIDKYDNDASKREVTFILGLFRGYIIKLRVFKDYDSVCDELEAILNPIEGNKQFDSEKGAKQNKNVNTVLGELNALKFRLDNPLKQDGGNYLYTKYLKSKLNYLQLLKNV